MIRDPVKEKLFLITFFSFVELMGTYRWITICAYPWVTTSFWRFFHWRFQTRKMIIFLAFITSEIKKNMWKNYKICRRFLSTIMKQCRGYASVTGIRHKMQSFRFISYLCCSNGLCHAGTRWYRIIYKVYQPLLI